MRPYNASKILLFLIAILICILLMSGCGELGVQGPRQDVDDAPDIEELKSNQDVEGLINAMGYESDSKIHLDALHALINIGEPAVEPLIKALKDVNNEIRVGAASSLGWIGDARAIEPLIEVLNKYDDESMAENFLNCGNAQLEKAARSWASSHGYVVQPSSGGGPSWGK